MVDVTSKLQVGARPERPRHARDRHRHGADGAARQRLLPRRSPADCRKIVTGLERTPDGILHFTNLVLTAPRLRITGNGYRRRDGTFHFEGSGQQATYGPLTLKLDGKIDQPTLDLRLRPAQRHAWPARRASRISIRPRRASLYRATASRGSGRSAATARSCCRPAAQRHDRDRRARCHRHACARAICAIVERRVRRQARARRRRPHRASCCSARSAASSGSRRISMLDRASFGNAARRCGAGISISSRCSILPGTSIEATRDGVGLAARPAVARRASPASARLRGGSGADHRRRSPARAAAPSISRRVTQIIAATAIACRREGTLDRRPLKLARPGGVHAATATAGDWRRRG